MDMTSTSQETGITEAQAAERLIARYQSDEDQGEAGETQGQEPEPEVHLTDLENEDEVELPDDPDADPDGEDEPDEASQTQTYKVKVNGEEVEVPLDELLKGYSREQDYTRKTQAAAEKAKALEAEAKVIAETREAYSSRLQQVEEFLKAAEPKVDQALRASNPSEWAAQMHELRRNQEQRQAVEAERQRLDHEAQIERDRELKDIVKAEGERLLAALPDWQDEAKAKEEQIRLRDYGKSVGLSDDEVDSIVDHRVVVALRKAMLWDDLQARAPAVRERVEKVRTTAPGATRPVSTGQATREKQARERLALTGSTDAAVELLLSRSRRP